MAIKQWLSCKLPTRATRLDKDSSGHLDREELKQLLHGLSFRWKHNQATKDKEVGEQDIEEAINEMDWSGNEEVSFEEFEAWWTRRQERFGSDQATGRHTASDDDNQSAGEDDAEDEEELDQLERKVTFRIKAEIEAVERRLDAKLDGINERLDSVAQLLESLVGRSGGKQMGVQP